jgi:hypothetical protein
MNENLPAFESMARMIGRQLAERPQYFITHPSELKLFGSLSAEQLSSFARRHGWRVVVRVGGRQIEFYNDARERQAMSRAREAAASGQPPSR